MQLKGFRCSIDHEGYQNASKLGPFNVHNHSFLSGSILRSKGGNQIGNFLFYLYQPVYTFFGKVAYQSVELAQKLHHFQMATSGHRVDFLR